MKSIAIIGAAGFVGQFLVDSLNKIGIVPTTITRANGLLLLSKRQVNPILVDDLDKLTNKFDVVINLAYPSSGKTYLVNRANDNIIKTIEKLSDQNTKIIHTSSLAVFGYTLQHPIENKKLSPRRDWDYVEGKIYIENQLISKFKNNELHIVRLGNVGGPGSTNWTVPLINNILYSQPTAMFGKDGFSNLTDVNNTADYLKFLATMEQTEKIYHIHHLAEFYDVKWSFYLDKISALFNMPIKSIHNLAEDNSETSNILQDVKIQFMPVPFRNKMKDLYKTKVAGSYLKSLVSSLPIGLLKKVEKVNVKIMADTPEQVENPIFFKIMSGTVPFKNITDPRWKPLYSVEESWQEIEKWIKGLGYHY